MRYCLQVHNAWKCTLLFFTTKKRYNLQLLLKIKADHVWVNFKFLCRYLSLELLTAQPNTIFLHKQSAPLMPSLVAPTPTHMSISFTSLYPDIVVLYLLNTCLKFQNVPRTTFITPPFKFSSEQFR